jgi:uncharacterized membrane protein
LKNPTNKRFSRKEAVFVIVFVIILAILAILPTGFEKQIYFHSEGVKAKVLTVDDSATYNNGLIKQGGQSCSIRILTGSHKGDVVTGTNLYIGKMEFDKVFVPGDTAWVLLEFDSGGGVIYANMVEHYRIDLELLLIGLFAVLLILFSGFTGVRTLLSFAFALFCIWKLLIPFMLKGYNPVVVALLIGNAITIATLLLVAGFTKKAYAAIVGSVLCSLVTCCLAILLGGIFKITGAVMQWSESLLYAGFEHLNLTLIFQAGIYLACSGAILDLAIDISAALDEIVVNSPDITRKQLIRSGMTIGKSVVGSQTTTLLLAYMGGYISVMMVYMAQGTPMMNILNSKMIASEILHTFVGCIGLVLVSPLTAVICGFLYQRKVRLALKPSAGLDASLKDT